MLIRVQDLTVLLATPKDIFTQDQKDAFSKLAQHFDISYTTAEPIRSQPRLTTLPRETRNQIYRYLVVSSKPIKVCYDDNSSWFYLRAGRQNKDISVEFLCHAVVGSELAQETYEEFFRNNIFDCSCQNLRRFLTTATTRFNSLNNFLVPTTTNHGYMKFQKMPWIRKVKISIYNDVFERKPSEHLAYLLKCPHLQQVEIRIFGLDNKFDEINPIHRTIEAMARVCKSIRDKIAGGLIVKVQQPWNARRAHARRALFMVGDLELEDISWMWEEPSEEAKGIVGAGFGTNNEKIQVFMDGLGRRGSRSLGRALALGTH